MRPRPLPQDRRRLAIGVLLFLIVALSALTVMRGHGVDNHPEGFTLGQGETTYRGDDVLFTFDLIAPPRVDPDQLFAEVVLFSDGEVIEHVLTNASVAVDDGVIAGLRMFENVSVPHHGRDKHTLGFLLILYYKGRVVDQYHYPRVPWDG